MTLVSWNKMWRCRGTGVWVQSSNKWRDISWLARENEPRTSRGPYVGWLRNTQRIPGVHMMGTLEDRPPKNNRESRNLRVKNSREMKAKSSGWNVDQLRADEQGELNYWRVFVPTSGRANRVPTRLFLLTERQRSTRSYESTPEKRGNDTTARLKDEQQEPDSPLFGLG